MWRFMSVPAVGTLAVAAAAVFLGGCAADNHAGHGRHEAVSGMTCPKCETVWVRQKAGSAGGSKIQTLQWGREMACPDCDVMAKAYFKDGEKVLHDCPTCKVTPRPARKVTAPTHPKGTHI